MLFEDIRSEDTARARGKRGYAKIDFTCKQAATDGLQYAWVDTCCINKDSSAELSEAINSMFLWYFAANVCYAYLTDLPGHFPVVQDDQDRRWHSEINGQTAIMLFSSCRWFTRGWTLQELIGPWKLRFYGRDWKFVQEKRLIGKILETITGVDSSIFLRSLSKRPTNLRDLRKHLKEFSVAQRMSWAAKRQNARREDEAYSLFGIFDVNLPLVYGEGEKAFGRLQEAIIASSTD